MFSTVAEVWTVILSCPWTASMSSDTPPGSRSVHGALRGKLWVNFCAQPPSSASFSTSTTSYPASAEALAEVRPDTPPPMTSTVLLISTISGVGASPFSTLARAMRM